MEASIILIAIGIAILYFLFDYFALCHGNLNTFGDKWVTKTLWLWLPVYGLFRLVKEVILKKK